MSHVRPSNGQSGSEGDAGAAPVTCRVARLDDIWTTLGSPSLRLLKIDVEGFEADVLEGAGRLLEHTEHAFVEVTPAHGLPAATRAMKALETAGFILRVYDDGIQGWREVKPADMGAIQLDLHATRA